MRIHNYGNDYVQADKFKQRVITNVENKAEVNRPNPAEQISTPKEEKGEEKDKAKNRKKKGSDKANDIQQNTVG